MPKANADEQWIMEIVR